MVWYSTMCRYGVEHCGVQVSWQCRHLAGGLQTTYVQLVHSICASRQPQYTALFHRVDVVCQQSITINVTEMLHYSSHIGNIPTRVRRHFNLGSAIDRRPSNQIFYRLHWSSTLIWMFSARCQVLLCSWVTVGFQKRRHQPGRRFTLKLGNRDY